MPHAEAHLVGHVHGSGQAHAHGRRAAPRRALLIALSLTAGFMLVEFAVGMWSGSLALLADAGHMLGDAGALALALVVSHIAARPRSAQKTYGYRRAEVLGALINALALFGASVWIVLEATERVLDPPRVRGGGVVVAAALGLVVNLSAAWVLSRQGGESINVRSAMLHVLGDALGSVAALVAGGLLFAFGLRIADPIASLVIAVLLVSGSVRLLLETSHVLMEGVPRGLDVDGILATIQSTEGVASVHDLHVWSLTPGEPVLTAHVVISPERHGTEVARRVGERLAADHGIDHVTIQPEPPAPEDVLVPLRLRRHS